jgi:hypothetical protein
MCNLRKVKLPPWKNPEMMQDCGESTCLGA